MWTRIASGLLVLGLAAPAAALQDWDRNAVNAVATELATAARTLKGAVLGEPQLTHQAHAGDERAAELLESIDVMGKVARRMARALGDGMDREETLPLATMIRERALAARRRAAELLGASWLDENLAPVEALVARLAPYYFD